MKVTGFSLFILMLPIFSTADLQRTYAPNDPLASSIGLILPRPERTDAFQKHPKPLTIRITNHGQETVYLQGIRDTTKAGKIQLYFYHQEEGKSWQTYFDSLPCNLPSCRNLSSRKGQCGEGEPVVIRLGAKGTYNAVQEFQWGGLFYELNEAIRENRTRRYCYKGWIPNQGKVRVEIKHSKTVSRDEQRKEMIEDRNYSAVEFKLPAAQKIYEIHLKG